MQDHTVALSRDDMSRTLVRIWHEEIEKNPPHEADSGSGFAIVGVHRRGAVLANRLHSLTRELTDAEVPFGTVDISFYRDALGIRANGPDSAPVVHSTQLDFSLDDRTIVIVDDV